MIDFWNNRYAADNYAYGKEPNAFFKSVLDSLDLKGSILLPAEGEGRNAVYAAKKGLDVIAYDISKEGQKKALRLAKKEKVSIAYFVGDDMSAMPIQQGSFDFIALIFAHFPAMNKVRLHRQIAKMLKPNGILILEGFSKSHIKNQEENIRVGGPKNVEMLFSKEEIQQDFNNFEIELLEEIETELQEGDFHSGKSSVIRFIGRKN